MTLKELSQLYYLNREIESDKERLKVLRNKVLRPSVPNFTGMPNGGSLDNRLERYIAEIINLEGIIQEKITRCIRERSRLERYIADIPDSLTRQIFTLRFINGFSWVQVANSLGYCTSDCARMICNRYIEKSNKTVKI